LLNCWIPEASRSRRAASDGEKGVELVLNEPRQVGTGCNLDVREERFGVLLHHPALHAEAP